MSNISKKFEKSLLQYLFIHFYRHFYKQPKLVMLYSAYYS